LQVHASFEAVVDLIRDKRDMLLLKEVEDCVRLVRYSPGRIEFEPAAGAKPDLASRLGQRLQGCTGAGWGGSDARTRRGRSRAPGRLAFEPAAGAHPDLASRLGQRLQGWTGARWGVSVVGSGGAPTIAEARDAEDRALKSEAEGNPLVQAVLAAFPGTTITAV